MNKSPKSPKSNKPTEQTKNIVKCLLCGEIIESKYRHDFVSCKCGNVAVDGGTDYCKVSFQSTNWEFITQKPQ
ncbi:MAG TPA: hypothetical protein DC057_10045 [Spirochaetia bacterium]|nr:hypothetical protein [Spirochaetia bacterium]